MNKKLGQEKHFAQENMLDVQGSCEPTCRPTSFLGVYQGY